MESLTFKKFIEATDIFGFDRNKNSVIPDDSMLQRPISQFDVELMMDLLSKKNIGNIIPKTPFMNEIRWGDQPGAVKLDVDTGYTFYVRKLGKDKQGHDRWLSKKMFQLNRQGYGGLEDIVADEIHNELAKIYEGPLDSPITDYSDLEHLTLRIYDKAKKVMKNIFIPEGIRKLSDNAYIIKMGVRGHGLEGKSQKRVEQNQTMVSYDPECGTIRINNYNIESPVGGPHSWNIKPSDLDLYCFPSQGKDEISELVAVHYKYY
jgi:hypothetical protein